MERICITITIFVILNSISDSVSESESFLNIGRGGLKIHRRRTRETQDAYFFPKTTVSYHKSKTSFTIAPPPNYSSKRQRKIHISEFTNPRTGLNPFLDLLEGTSNNTGRTKNFTISKSAVIHVIPPPKPTVNKPREIMHEETVHILNFKPKSLPTFIKTPPVKNEWPRIHLEPVEGESGGRAGRPPGEKTSLKRISHFQDVMLPQPRGVQRNSKVTLWEDDTTKQNILTNINNNNETTTIKSFTIPSPLPNITNISTTSESNLYEEKTIHKSPMTVKPKLNRIKNSHEQIYSIKIHHKTTIISIVSSVTAVFLIILLTMCFYKGRSKRVICSRQIALENINTTSNTKKIAEINYNLSREYQAVKDKEIIK